MLNAFYRTVTRACVKMLFYFFFCKVRKKTSFLSTSTGLSFKLLMIFKMSLVIVQSRVC